MPRNPTGFSSLTLLPLAQVEVQEIDGTLIGQFGRLRFRSGSTGPSEAVTDFRIGVNRHARNGAETFPDPEVGHGFARPGTTGAEAKAAELANQRTVDFLNLNLR